MQTVLRLFFTLLLLTSVTGLVGCSSEVDPAADIDEEEFTEKAYDDPNYIEENTRTVE